MFGFFTYPHKVADALFVVGYLPDQLPMTREWIGLIHAFRKKNYPPARAAEIIDGAFSKDPEALAEAWAIGGPYAIGVFGPQAG